MAKGNFVPAAKYLFDKYIMYFDPEDGLSFEHSITKYNPPLSLLEVKRAVQNWLKKQPGSIEPSTLEAFRKIERLSRRLKKSIDMHSRGSALDLTPRD